MYAGGIVVTAATRDALTKGQRRFLQRRYCGWCEARIDGDTCHAMFGEKCTPADMQARREAALLTYRPRARAAMMGEGA